MRLREIGAIRYGGMRDASLGPLRDGLNVVVGPNEAGKSTYAALVRHVIFGFPRKGGAQRDYVPAGDENRAGRLVFEDEDGSRWTLSRAGGTSKGEPELTGAQGSSNAATFIDRLSSGISPELYRHVFGFGLEELANFDSLATIQDHLHAGVTGLETNPREALKSIEQRAGELYRQRGRTQVINALGRELSDARKRQRELAEVAGDLVGERQELARVEDRLVQRREELEDLVRRSEQLAALSARIDSQNGQAAAVELELKEAERAREHVAQELADVDVDSALLERGPGIDSLAPRVESYEADAQERRELESAFSGRDAEVVSLAAVLGSGWDGNKAIAFRADSSNESAAASFASRAERLTIEADAAATKLERSRAVLDDMDREARDALHSAGLGSDTTAQEVAAAMAEADAALTSGTSTSARPTAAIVLAILGVVVAAWGALSSDYVTLALGGLSVLVSIVLLLIRSRSSSASAGGAPQAAVRRRGSLEHVADRMAEAARLRKEWSADEREAAFVQEKQEKLAAEWGQWCADHSLDSSDAPQNARDLVGSITRLAEAAQRARDSQEALARVVAKMEQFESSARDVGIQTEDLSPEAIMLEARGLATALTSAREAAARQKTLGDEHARVQETLAARGDALKQTRDTLGELLDEAGVSSASEMEGAVAAAREMADQMRDEVTRLSNEQGEIVGRLEVVAQEDERAVLSLKASELNTRLSEAIGRYAVLALASKMLASTLATYERERQPEVIRLAEQAFATMTDGRYCQILNPLGEFDPMICSASGEQKDNEILSTGTAQQLYLALRLAYIETLGDRGPALPVLMDDVLVNFDDSRRHNTAQLLSEFAADRQVVLFTCHQSTVETFAALGDEANIIKL